MENQYLSRIEEALASYLPAKDCLQKDVIEAMEYSLLAGGKRIRPTLTLEFCRVCGGDVQAAMPFACAVEMIHSYSLIHDDSYSSLSFCARYSFMSKVCVSSMECVP